MKYFSLTISSLFAGYIFVVLAFVEKLTLLKAGLTAVIFFVMMLLISIFLDYVITKDLDR